MIHFDNNIIRHEEFHWLGTVHEILAGASCQPACEPFVVVLEHIKRIPMESKVKIESLVKATESVSISDFKVGTCPTPPNSPCHQVDMEPSCYTRVDSISAPPSSPVSNSPIPTCQMNEREFAMRLLSKLSTL